MFLTIKETALYFYLRNALGWCCKHSLHPQYQLGQAEGTMSDIERDNVDLTAVNMKFKFESLLTLYFSQHHLTSNKHIIFRGQGVPDPCDLGGGRSWQWAEHPVWDPGGQAWLETHFQRRPPQTRGDQLNQAWSSYPLLCQVMSGSKRGSQLFTVMAAGNMVPNEV